MTSGHRVDVRANANKAENSNQGVGNHNIASIVCCDHRAARSLGSAIIAVVIIVAIVCGVIFGLRDRNNNSHDAQPTTTTPTTSSLAPSQTTPSSGIMSSTLSTTPTISSTILPPPSPTADGVRLVNYMNETAKGSGFAWYRSAQMVKEGTQPDDFAVATVNVDAHWEGQNRTGYFDNDVIFWAFINSTTTASVVNELVGIASNGYRDFHVYKDDGELLYKENETDFYSIYYCQ